MQFLWLPKPFCLIILLTTTLHSFSQIKYTVSGTVRDKTTGESLIGATVLLLEQPRSAASSNAYGFYSISAPAGNYTMIISFTGYQADTLKIVLNRNLLLPVELGNSAVA
jgi:hypothetical protein